MVVLEVAQITLKNWTINDDVSGDIYLEVYFERRAGSCVCCGQEKRRLRRDRVLSARCTDKVCEAGEMLWRKYNEDNFLVGLFRLEGTSWRSLRHGEIVTIVVDVRRVPRGMTLNPGDRGELMQVMKGPLQLGYWGNLTLRPVDASPFVEEADLPVVTMELRPRTMRPFMLEFAKPDLGGLGSGAEDIHVRGGRMSTISQDSFLTFSGSSGGSVVITRVHSGAKAAQRARQSPGSLNNFSPRNSADIEAARNGPNKNTLRRGLERLVAGDMPQRKRSLSWSERHSSDRNSSDKSRSVSNKAGSNSDEKVSETARSALAWSPAGSYKGSDGNAPSSANSGNSLSDDQNDPVRLLTLSEEERARFDSGQGRCGRGCGPRNPKQSKYRDLSMRLRALVRRHHKNMRKQTEQDCPKNYTAWTPENWEAFWRTCWPKDDDILGEAHDVAPLMEAEFRKDCVIFFNTLFPRSRSDMFNVLRKLAFDPGGSKVSFKLLSDRRQADIVGRGSSQEVGSVLDTNEDLARLTEDGGLAYRVTMQALEGMRHALRRGSSRLRHSATFSSQGSFRDPSIGTPEDDHPDRPPERLSPKKTLWSKLFSKQDAHPRSEKSPKAVRIDSPSNSRSLQDNTSRMASSSSGISAEEGNEERLEGFVPPETTGSENLFSVPLGEAAADIEREESKSPRRGDGVMSVAMERERSTRRSSITTMQSLGRQQPCMCTVSTPKGVFVDEYTPRVMLLKRVILCFAICGVYYTEVSNVSQLAELWPYPLASVLGHGSRVLIRLEDVDAAEFINFLMFGEPLCVDWKEHGLPYPLMRRLAATHTVQLDAETGNLVERKLQVMSASDTMQNISDGIRRKHLGINLPIGGVGNPSPMGKEHYIDFTGRVVQNTTDRQRRYSFLLARRTRGESGDRLPPTPSGGAATGSISMDLSRENGAAFRGRSSVISTGSIADQLENGGQDSGGPGPPLQPRLSMVSRASLGSIGSLEGDNPDDSPGPASTPQAAKSKRRIRLLNNIQGGHLYIRVDEFGEQRSRGGYTEGGIFGRRSEVRKNLLKKPRGYSVVSEQAKLQARLYSSCMECGDVFFSQCIPTIRRRRAAGMHRDHCGNMTLLRMCSEPSFNLQSVDRTANCEDAKWAKEAIVTTSRWPIRVPPSAVALRLVLDHFHPMNVDLYGKGGFKSIEDLWRELRAQRSFLLKDGNSLQRYVEPVVLQLRWKGYILMSTGETFEDETGEARTVPKHSFVCASMRPDEHWKEVIDRMLASQFRVSTTGMQAHLKAEVPEAGHTIIEETMESPSYPGLSSFYRSHMVQWDIKDEAAEHFAVIGLPFDTARRDELFRQGTQPKECDFSTNRGSMKRRRFYRWVPESVSRELQRFLNMTAQTADDRWAKYAFQSEGVVQYPPTVEALGKLLGRCGIDVGLYGQNHHKSLSDFWLELLNQESYLMMNSGTPCRMVESLFVKVRWKQHRRGASKVSQNAGCSSSDSQMVLVKKVVTEGVRESVLTEGDNAAGVGLMPAEDDNDATATWSLLNTRKYRAETWEDCMMRCVMKELGLTRQQLKSVYERQMDEDGRYAFHDLVRQSKSFPGIQTLYRTHLVTIMLKEDYANILGKDAFAMEDNNSGRTSCNLPAPPSDGGSVKRKSSSLDNRRRASSNGSSVAGPTTATSGGSLDPASSRSRSRSDIGSASGGGTNAVPGAGSGHLTPGKSFLDMVRTGSDDGETHSKTLLVWLPEDGTGRVAIEDVHGTDFWVEARKREENVKVSSVLIGLEGTAPQRKSPFGVEHDASGTSAKVSATGGRKWRAYGKNNALQIPSEHGGMHLKITKSMFKEFMHTCQTLDLVEPCSDLVPESESVCTRGDLERRYAEKELFKQVLSGNGRQAHQAVELMKEYCSTLRTPNQAYNAITRSRSLSSPLEEPQHIPHRVTVAPITGDIVCL